MSAELLREAADLMRERARASTPGPWEPQRPGFTFNPCVTTAGGGEVGVEFIASEDWVAECGPDAGRGVQDSQHIASWHPAVALAVADLIDTWSHWTGNPDDLDLIEVTMSAVARAYLGRTS